MAILVPANLALLWRSLWSGFVRAGVLELLLQLARTAGLRLVSGLALVMFWTVQTNVTYATERDRSDGYLGGAVAALLPPDVWEGTKDAPNLEVRYVAREPDLSRPLAAEPEGSIALFILSLLAVATAITLVAASWRAWIPEE